MIYLFGLAYHEDGCVKKIFCSVIVIVWRILLILTMPLSLVSLNIEKDKHVERILPFLKRESPDVVFLQEIFLDTLTLFETTLGMTTLFAPMKKIQHNHQTRLFGLAVLSRLPLVSTQTSYYYLDASRVPEAPEGTPLSTARCVLHACVEKNHQLYSLINTHFTWTPDGNDSPQQHEDLGNFLKLLSAIPEFILAGDFNAPRGGIIFQKLASLYKDNIPSHITSTLDPDLHRAGHKHLVVDSLFTTPAYDTWDVQVIQGLSDHCAVMAKIMPHQKT
ncbi:MAG: endonuclease/exonuclease/phosphatase family protein [Alphaproteobacteria bacterium]|jgi:endonuclease/exonuclease/phosphatase family metal-dependent hydrolase|nr:endonuclease/exonuclease/phosphatase family protein [Alphaproteobacteria bacterium]